MGTPDYGVLSDLVPVVTAFMAGVSALTFAFKGRAKWEPAEEDIPNSAQRVGGLVTAVLIALIWYHLSYKGADSGVVGWIALGLAVFTLVAVLMYGYLVGLLTFDKIVALDDGRTKTRKIIGGFSFTPEAEALVKKGVTPQDVFQGLAYKEDAVWPRRSRVFAKMMFQAAYIVLIASGTSALTTAAILVSDKQADDLPLVMDQWIKAAESAREAGTVVAHSPLPTELLAARSAFQTAWQNAGLGARKKLDQKKTSKALSYVTRTHRLEETDSPTHSSSIAWSDIAIRHFEEAQERDLLTEALLDKAAIYLDLSQLEHNSKEDFKRISQAGDGVITRTIGMATGNARTEALRVSSRFYYNLARPQSFMLSDTWDNNYLLLAYRRAEEASAIAPKDIKNANQLLRAAMKTAKNPPQSLDPQWREKLRTAKNNMRARWDEHKDQLKRVNQRLSPLNVLGTGTTETIAREWHDVPGAQRPQLAAKSLAEIETDGLALLQEAEALLQNAELKKSYGFDIYYDIARTYAQRVVMLRLGNKRAAQLEYDEVKANILRARPWANQNQLDAAVKDIQRDLSFSKLQQAEKNELLRLLRYGK